MEPLVKDYEKVAKKQKQTSEASLHNLDSLIQLLTETRDALNSPNVPGENISPSSPRLWYVSISSLHQSCPYSPKSPFKIYDRPSPLYRRKSRWRQRKSKKIRKTFITP